MPKDGFYSIVTAFPRDLDYYKIQGKLIWQRPGDGRASIDSSASVTPPSKQRTGYLGRAIAVNDVANNNRNSGSKSDYNINTFGDLSSGDLKKSGRGSVGRGNGYDGYQIDADGVGAVADEGMASVGDTFGTIRRNVVPEVGKTPLFEKKFRSFSDIAVDLFEIYNAFPESVTAADGKTVFVRNKQNDRDSARLFHLVASNDATNGKRNTIEIATKVPWITRIPETLENAQVKLQDNKSHNYIYARSYTDGYWHFVIVSEKGVVIGGNSYQHGLITQFAEDHSSNRDDFFIVWESYGKASKQPNRAHGEESQGYAPISSPGNDNNISSFGDLSSYDLKKSGRGSVGMSAPSALRSAVASRAEKRMEIRAARAKQALRTFMRLGTASSKWSKSIPKTCAFPKEACFFIGNALH